MSIYSIIYNNHNQCYL